ncbi:MAG: hypothetical protein ACK55I_36100, partial [bacterium]
PREENKLADALTNRDFGEFSSERRVPLCWADVDLPIARELLALDGQWREELDRGSPPGQQWLFALPSPSRERWYPAHRDQRITTRPFGKILFGYSKTR